MFYRLNEFELLRSVNQISQNDGGCHVGNVGSISAWKDEEGMHFNTYSTYRNNWCVAVELIDEARNLMGGKVAPGDHQWKIHAGFCQTSIKVAPNGGYPLLLPASLIALCPTCDSLLELWDCLKGKVNERKEKLETWYENIQRWEAQHEPILVQLNAMVNDAALEYAQVRGGIDQ